MKILFLTALLAFVQNPNAKIARKSDTRDQQPARTETGTIAGAVKPPGEATITQPLQIVLLSSRYVEMWDNDLQRRLDIYWERYKPTFAQKKEFFLEVSRIAHRETIQYVIGRMRRELRERVTDFVKESPKGPFEFRDVPLGEYKILALGRIGGQDLIWSESVEVASAIPQFIELKKLIP